MKATKTDFDALANRASPGNGTAFHLQLGLSIHNQPVQLGSSRVFRVFRGSMIVRTLVDLPRELRDDERHVLSTKPRFTSSLVYQSTTNQCGLAAFVFFVSFVVKR